MNHVKTSHVIADLIDERRVAQILGVSARTVFTLTQQGKIPAIRIGTSKRYDPADIQAFIERSRDQVVL